jgi:hypothetical protein
MSGQILLSRALTTTLAKSVAANLVLVIGENRRQGRKVGALGGPRVITTAQQCIWFHDPDLGQVTGFVH